MVLDIFKNIVRFVLLVLLQVLVLNRINVHGFVSPYIYILFILLLPLEAPPLLSMVLGLILGLSIDKFSNTAGIHASACVLLAFVRPVILRRLRPIEGYRPEDKPHISVMGTGWFISYVLLCTLVHHVYLFTIEAFSFSGIIIVLIKTAINVVISSLLIISTQALLEGRSGR